MLLKRDTKNGIIAGVCAGIANYLHVDPIAIRLGFLFSTFVWGIGIIPYIVLWIIMPPDDGTNMTDSKEVSE